MGGCELCPRRCGIDRSAGKKGFCGTTEDIYVTRAALHMWEEPCISGTRGSGTVFFSGCNLHCCFCQNYDISRGNAGKSISVERLSEIFLELQEKQANNINLVTPTHYIPQIISALELAGQNGLRLPIVYNCGGYETAESVRRLSDYVDVWLPDMKYKSSELSTRYSNAPDYFDRAAEALEEMVKSVEKKGGICFTRETAASSPDREGESLTDNEGLVMTRGVIVRHMTLPGATADSKRLLRYLHERYGERIYISIMSQYTPMPHIINSDRFPELKRTVDKAEYGRLVDFAEKIGIEKAYIQEGEVARESFIPSFDGSGV